MKIPTPSELRRSIPAIDAEEISKHEEIVILEALKGWDGASAVHAKLALIGRSNGAALEKTLAAAGWHVTFAARDDGYCVATLTAVAVAK